jgi:hypothetical protein
VYLATRLEMHWEQNLATNLATRLECTENGVVLGEELPIYLERSREMHSEQQTW